MKHAGPDALNRLTLILAALRALPEIHEKRPGVFYRRSKAFLHFHDDLTGLYADVRAVDGADFDRFKVDEAGQDGDFVALVAARLNPL